VKEACSRLTAKAWFGGHCLPLSAVVMAAQW